MRLPFRSCTPSGLYGWEEAPSAADLLRDLDLVGRKELLAVSAKVLHVTGDDHHELSAAAIELEGLEVARVDADEVVLVVESGSGKVGSSRGGRWLARDGRCGRSGEPIWGLAGPRVLGFALPQRRPEVR